MRKKLAGPLILLLLSVAFYWRIALTDQFTWLDSPDMANMVLPRFQFMAGEWHHMRFPLWDPHHWNGQPFLGQWTGAAMPLNWPLFVLGGFREGEIRLDLMNWYFVLVHWIGAVFCYALCRDLERSRGAAILAAVIFAFGGYFGNTDWPEIFTACVWIPLVFLFLLRAVRGERPVSSAAASGMFCGMAWLAGHHQAPFYLTVAVMAVWAMIAIARSDWMTLRYGAITVGFAGAVGALQIIPGHEYGKLAIRWAGAPSPLGWQDTVPYMVHVQFSLQPQDFFGIVIPHLGGHVSLLAGVVALIASAAAIHGCWGQLPVRVFAGVAIGGLLFALAELNVFYGVLYSLVPGFEKARVPARAAMLWSFAVAPLAAYGIDRLAGIDRSRWVSRLLRTGALFFIPAFLLLAMKAPEFVGRVELLGVYLMAAAGLLALGARWMVPGLIALSMIEISAGRILTPHPNPQGVLAKLSEHKEAVKFLENQTKPFRVQTGDEISYNFGDWHRLDTLGGFSAGVTANIMGIAWPGEKTRRMLGVKYVVAKKPSTEGLREVFASSNGWKVFEDREALPRAWVVHQVKQVANPEKVREEIALPATDLRRHAFLTAPAPTLEACEDREEISWQENKAATIRFAVDAACKGLVVVSDTWYPGWTAAVDGVEREILEVNGAIRGVVVEAGRHTVEMRFRGRAVYAGAFLTILGIAGALWLQFSRAGKDRAQTPS
jgi:hypothetical protein